MVEHQEEAARVAFLRELRLAHALELAAVQPLPVGVNDHELSSAGLSPKLNRWSVCAPMGRGGGWG